LPSHDLLTAIAVSIISAAALALLARRVGQPLLLGYVVGGALLGPHVGLRIITDEASIELISEIGLLLLLFIIGLEMNIPHLLKAGRAIAVTGFLQFPLCAGLGWLAVQGIATGGTFDHLYLAVAFALSSTLIVVKLLFDKFEIATFTGRITLGILVFQDLWAILFLAVQPNLSNLQVGPLARSIVAGVGLLVAAVLIARYILPALYRSIASSTELVLLVSMAWCFLLSGAAAKAGLSGEMGSLIAGLVIAGFPYGAEVTARLGGVRDFFLTLFFVALGLKIPLPTLRLLLLAGAAALFVMASRLVVVVPMLALLRVDLRSAGVVAINLAQVSEFSIVIASLGLARQPPQIGADVLTIVIITFALTSVASTYMINSSHHVQRFLSRILRTLRIKDLDSADNAQEQSESRPETLVFLGFFRDASSILHEFEHDGEPPEVTEFLNKILVVDFNPTVMRELRQRGISCVYGDVAHADTLRHVGIQDAELVVSTITDDILRGTNNLRMMRNIRATCPKAKVMLTTEHIPQALQFYEQGADFVYLPRLHSAPEIARILKAGLRDGFDEARRLEIERLSARKEVLA